jgi:alpha-beta hydrolase superfamily lysophospholipase
MHYFSALILIFLGLVLLFPVLLHWIYRAPRVTERSTPEQCGLPFTQHYLTGVKNKRLYAWMIAAQKSHTTLLIVHGWGGNAEMMLPLAQPFHQKGMNVLLYDARNHGKSDADSFSSLPRFAEDLGTALDWVKQRNPHHRLVVLGHSIGSAAAILAASHRDDIDLLIGLSGFAHPDLVMKRHLDRPWLPRFLRPLILNYIQWVIGFRFNDIAPMNRIQHVRCPVLLAHGTEDTVVPISDMRLIEANATPQRPIRVLDIEGAKHDSVEHFQRHAGQLIDFIHENLNIE